MNCYVILYRWALTLSVGHFLAMFCFASHPAYNVGDLVTTIVANKPVNASTYLRLWKCTTAYIGGKDTTQVAADGTLSW